MLCTNVWLRLVRVDQMVVIKAVWLSMEVLLLSVAFMWLEEVGRVVARADHWILLTIVALNSFYLYLLLLHQEELLLLPDHTLLLLLAHALHGLEHFIADTGTVESHGKARD
jgi:hypothetical protein